MRAHNGMPGKGQFILWRKDAHSEIGLANSGRENEGGFGQVHLAGNALHGRRIQPGGVGEDGQWIAAKGLIGKHVHLVKVVSGHDWVRLLSDGRVPQKY